MGAHCKHLLDLDSFVIYNPYFILIPGATLPWWLPVTWNPTLRWILTTLMTLCKVVTYSSDRGNNGFLAGREVQRMFPWQLVIIVNFLQWPERLGLTSEKLVKDQDHGNHLAAEFLLDNSPNLVERSKEHCCRTNKGSGNQTLLQIFMCLEPVI